MKFLTSKGKVEEGFQLTEEEAEILNSEIITDINGEISGQYISGSTALQIAAYYLKYFKLSWRVPPKKEPDAEILDAEILDAEFEDSPEAQKVDITA